jgi:hypothetical protein
MGYDDGAVYEECGRAARRAGLHSLSFALATGAGSPSGVLVRFAARLRIERLHRNHG